MPRSSLNLILLIITISLARLLIWFYFDLDIEKIELLSVIGVATTATIGFGFISKPGKEWFQEIASKALNSYKSTKNYCILIGLLSFSLCIVGRIDVIYTFEGDLKVNINGKEVSITGDGKEVRKKFYGLAFTPLEVNLGDFQKQEKYLPLHKIELILPFDILMEHNMDLQRIEGVLTYSLFQFYETKYFATAKSLITAQKEDNGSKKPLTRLSLILQILELSITGPDASDSKSDLLFRFKTEFPDDSWYPLLSATISYSKGDYLTAANTLLNYKIRTKWPGEVAVEFFKSVCYLKGSRTNNDKDKTKNLALALEGFQKSELLAASIEDSPFKKHSIASSIIFKAILNFYQNNISSAKNEFLRATEIAEGSLKARAYNGYGYLEFIEGNLDQAEIAFLNALESDPNFAYALSNYGYVLMAKSQFESALHYFERNAKSDELKANSPRDVLLAELAVGHAREEMGGAKSEISDYYSNILEHSGRRNFYGVTPVSLRLAYQYNEMAAKIYLSKDYYGLEVFALALLSKALNELDSTINEDIRTIKLQEEIKGEMLKIKPVIPLAWLTDGQNRGAFFSWIKKY